MTTTIEAKIDLLFRDAIGVDENTLYMDDYALRDAVMNVIYDHFDLRDISEGEHRRSR